MRAIVMAGGFAKRLWPITKNKPKPLLVVGGKPIVEHILEKLEDLKLGGVYITTNSRFESHFSEWLREFDSPLQTKLCVEPATSEYNKMGAIGAINYLIRNEKIDDDVLIVAGDNMFEFLLSDFLDFYKEKKTPVVALYDVEDYEDAKRFGVVSLDEDGRVVGFEEKPEKPESTLVSTGCYVFPKKFLKKISEYLEGGHNKDAPGHFVKWLSENTPVFGFRFKGKWFDIGSFESLKEASDYFSGRALQKAA